MTRLPTPGKDDGQWGTILNNYLEVAHNADGSLKRAGDIADAKAKADSAVQQINGKSGTSLTLGASDVSALPASSLGAANGAASLDSSGNVPASQLGNVPSGGSSNTITISQHGSSYTLAAGDAGSEVEYTGSSAGMFTIPANVFSVGQTFNLRQAGSGTLTITADSGVTLHAPNGMVLAGQWSTASVICRANNEFVLGGDTTS
jgi:hypothetical protein